MEERSLRGDFSQAIDEHEGHDHLLLQHLFNMVRMHVSGNVSGVRPRPGEEIPLVVASLASVGRGGEECLDAIRFVFPLHEVCSLRATSFNHRGECSFHSEVRTRLSPDWN